jgi:hypothetical protein
LQHWFLVLELYPTAGSQLWPSVVLYWSNLLLPPFRPLLAMHDIDNVSEHMNPPAGPKAARDIFQLPAEKADLMFGAVTGPPVVVRQWQELASQPAVVVLLGCDMNGHALLLLDNLHACLRC